MYNLLFTRLYITFERADSDPGGTKSTDTLLEYSVYFFLFNPATGLLAACTLLCILTVQKEIHMILVLKITRIHYHDTYFLYSRTYN